MNTRGFTLLEVLIAMGILAFVTVFTAQAIQKALQNRVQVQNSIDRTSNVREALSVMENDINSAFNFRDINIALYNEMAKERNKRIEEAKNAPPPNPGTPPPGPGSPPTNPLATAKPLAPRKEMIVTQFMGESGNLHFTSLSNVRTSGEARISDQAEVGYFLRSCRSRADRNQSSQCLYRRLSPYLDEDVTQGGNEVALVENVTRFELRYLSAANPTEWTTSFRSGEGADDTTRGQFPLAVEITLEVHNKTNPADKPTLMTKVAAVRNPNLQEKKSPSSPGQPPPIGGGN